MSLSYCKTVQFMFVSEKLLQCNLLCPERCSLNLEITTPFLPRKITISFKIPSTDERVSLSSATNATS